jgi:SAM-dependent methyltransferase
MQTALTDQRYWDELWRSSDELAGAVPPRVTPGATQRWLDRVVGARLAPGRRFLEVGAGASPWPARFAATTGADAWGIDFSRAGLALAARATAPGTRPPTFVEGDLFDRTRLPTRAFTVVYSGGFVEHFPRPRDVMERLAELLAPGGVVVTIVPNLSGVNGVLQRLVDREVWRRHVVLSPRALDAAHATGGLVPVEKARWLGPIDLGCVNFGRAAAALPPPLLRALWLGLSTSRRVGEWLAAHAGDRDGGRLLAPLVGGVYRRADD